jgi:vanillate O-demethylase monooxygenase subunit
VEERYGWLFVWLGNPELADAEAIPTFHKHMVDPEWHSVTGQAHAKCGYRLVLDNLLDLSHTAYVHTSFSGNPEVAELAKVKAELVDGTVRVTRMMRDIPPAPVFVKYGGYNSRINRWQVGNYFVPSFIYIVNGSTPAEQSLDGVDTVSSNGRWGWEVYHAVTPETAKTSHQFWAVSLPRKFLDESKHKEFEHQAIVVIDEDLAIYEAQQACIDADPQPLSSDVTDVNAKGALKFDDGLLKVRGIIRRLYAQEQRTAAGRP